MTSPMLYCDRPTTADIACFPCTKLAEESRINLSHSPNVLAWLERVRQLSNYISL